MSSSLARRRVFCAAPLASALLLLAVHLLRRSGDQAAAVHDRENTINQRSEVLVVEPLEYRARRQQLFLVPFRDFAAQLIQVLLEDEVHAALTEAHYASVD